MSESELLKSGNITKDQKQRIICFGDSITQGNENGVWPTEFQKLLENWKPGKFEVLNKGKSGDTTVHGFDRIPTDLIPNLPAVVIIEFGVNDSNYRPWAKVPRVGSGEFAKNLREFHRIITLHHGCSLFIVNHILNPIAGKYVNQGNGLSYQENLDLYNIVIRNIAKEQDSPVIDLPQELKTRAIKSEEFLFSDGVHLSPYGTKMYAEIVFLRFQELWESGQLR